jgi:hypothetical protein
VRRDVVAVADERQGAAGERAETLAEREEIRERLARVFLVGERVDDVEPPRGRANASRRDWANVRTTAPYTQRSRLRATSAMVSRPPSATSAGGSMTSPPSSRTATWNVERVRSDGFSKSKAT